MTKRRSDNASVKNKRQVERFQNHRYTLKGSKVVFRIEVCREGIWTIQITMKERVLGGMLGHTGCS